MDKINYKASQDPDVLATNPTMYINVTPDRESRTVTVEDSGIGMTRNDLVNNLGTIARSGTKAFMEAAELGFDTCMIGQFGVGFYSAYLVSEKIRVVSKHNDDEQYIWESSAGGTFSVWKDEDFEHGTLKRGTKVICYLKDDQHEFLDSDRLRDLMLKHSAFIEYPIELYAEHSTEEGEDDKKVVHVSYKWERVNKNKPLWLRPAADVTHDEYAELYKWLASDFEEHLAVRHVLQSGTVDFKALLFTPKNPPKDMFEMGKMARRFSIRLYVRRVFITEFNDLIPKWMGFIKGIVDSDDMPLNISREKLQENAILKHVKAGIQKQCFEMFKELQQDKVRYRQFYDAFSQCLKLGVYEDHENRKALIPLLRYHTSKTGPNDMCSLDEYCARMKTGQQYILYVTGRSLKDAMRSPHAEGLRRDGYEIVYMYDPMDEYAVQFIKDVNGCEMLSCMHGAASRLLDKGPTVEQLKKEMEPLRKRLFEGLKDEFARVLFSDELEPGTLGKLVKLGSGSAKLELNCKNSFLKEIASLKPADVTPELLKVVYDVASLEDADVDDPQRGKVSKHLQDMIHKLSVGDDNGCPEEMPVPDNEVTVQSLTLKRGANADAPLLSCGNVVRVVREDRARRAIISCVDEAKKTVDVLYPAWDGDEKEEDGVPAKKIQKLMPFEVDEAARAAQESGLSDSLYKTATAIKDEGNQLYKLKDFEAAHERYSAIVAAFCRRPRKQGEAVLLVEENSGPPKLKVDDIRNVDAEGNLELMSGEEIPAAATLPVFDQLLPLQTAAHMNRARCRQAIGLNKEAGQDLTVVLALWSAAPKRLLEADAEMKEAEAKAQYTARYLRAKSRLARGQLKEAGADIKAALACEPPQPMVKQLRELKTQVQNAQEEHRRVTAPLVKELAKLKMAVGGQNGIGDPHGADFSGYSS
eukprot:TRINITY_DN4351_c0_g4_i1.p1 TRINITY_DN4351_c0_g4~~TRINITY_DN4351_c0_g4_i1.p1  ORF type:complete len:1012 (-),score=281.64 TRINITY_DN4351_c0_g4_i1:201-2969(-)